MGNVDPRRLPHSAIGINYNIGLADGCRQNSSRRVRASSTRYEKQPLHSEMSYN
jgi:hypothetical protein